MGVSHVTPWASWIVWGVVAAIVLRSGHSLPEGSFQAEDMTTQDKPKLLYILLDGFRWDYIDKYAPDAFRGFNELLKEGVRARWTEPIFPVVSCASWTTLSTGLYPESHNIAGNYFYDAKNKDVFSLSDRRTTAKPKWWTSEPIWTTAEKAGLKTAQFHWSRCDIPIDGRTTHHCDPFINEEYHSYNFLRSIMMALAKFDEGYDFVQVYAIEPDVTGHKYGPDSKKVLEVLTDLDSVIAILLDELQERNLADNMHIVIVSDHGMEYTAEDAIERHEVDHYLDDSLVEKIAGSGGHMHFTVPQENIQQVFDQLSQIPGVSVYKRNDIPEELHFKRGKYAPDILLITHDGNYIMPSSGEKQLPPRSEAQGKGSHGLGIHLQSMRGIFFAKGPAFHQDTVIDPIGMVDVYQVLTKVLGITPQPHNGTWSHVEPAFSKLASSPSSPVFPEPPPSPPESDEHVNGSSGSLASSVLVAVFCVVHLFLASANRR